MLDTAKDIEEKHKKMMMALTGEVRLKMSDSMFQSALKMIEASLSPELTNNDKRKQIFLRLYKTDFTENEIEMIFSKFDGRNP
ncbi:MAG: hypothetical protein V1720_14085 [bacterium]